MPHGSRAFEGAGTALAQGQHPGGGMRVVTQRGNSIEPRRTRMKLLTMLMLAAALAVAGCNTMSGFGKDVEKAGDKIDDAATKKK